MTRPLDTELVTYVINLFPRLSPIEQRTSMALYRMLAEGRPVAHEALAARAGLPPSQVSEVLDDWFGVYYDSGGDIIAYGGLTLREMRHRLRINGRTLYAWCAWDTLFLPQILDAEVGVESACRVSGERIRLTVTPSEIRMADPTSTAVSFVTPDESKVKRDVVLNFCHDVHFFRSMETAENWLSTQSATRLLTLDQAWRLGREKNAAQYGTLLDSQGSATTGQAATLTCCSAG